MLNNQMVERQKNNMNHPSYRQYTKCKPFPKESQPMEVIVAAVKFQAILCWIWTKFLKEIIMIYLENRFRHPNQSNPKSMDAVFVRTIGVRLLSTMRARCTPKYTLLCPAPTQLKNSGQNRSCSFLENDASHEERLPAENGELVFPPS